MDKELKEKIADYFDAWELVEFLRLKTEDIIEAFESDVEEALDDIEDMIGLREDD